MNRLPNHCLSALVAAAALLAAPPLPADDVSGQDQLLCTTMQTSECDRLEEGGCQVRSFQALNVPLFLEIEANDRALHTTAASGDTRSTRIDRLEREEGVLHMQGSELGRAFAFLVDEASGLGTLSITSNGEVVVIFTACTPKEG